MEERKVGRYDESGIYLVKYWDFGSLHIQSATRNEILQMTITGKMEIDSVFFVPARDTRLVELELSLEKGKVTLKNKPEVQEG